MKSFVVRDAGLRRRLAVAASLCLCLASCHSSAARRAISPLIGTWQINGALPAPDASMPRFTQFTFHRDGRLDASYVAAGGLIANVVKSSSQVRQEQDSYTLVGDHHLRVIEGSRSLGFRYDVRDGKLFLTGSDGGPTTVYAAVHASDDEQQDAQ